MKKILLCAALSLIASLSGADFTYSLLGKYSVKHTVDAHSALTDGKLKYSDAHIIWDSTAAPKGCGFIINFAKPTAISRIAIVTAKPNRSPYIPERTEFAVWDEEKDVWQDSVIVKDITGRCKDPKFITADPIVTEWKGSAVTSAVKVTMYSGALWCTEIQVFDADGKQLQGEGWKLLPAERESLKYADGGCCPSINLSFYSKNGEYIGFPNSLPRRDRVIFSYDLRKYLLSGKVKQALLKVTFAPMGKFFVHRLALHAFASEHWPLQTMDIISGDVIPVAQMVYDKQSDGVYVIDVTDIVNTSLQRGDGYVGFRASSLTAEKFGNRNSTTEGVYLRHKLTSLEIVK